MNRYCFQLQVAPDRLNEYRRRHAAVWPEMLLALRRAGWQNYPLFLRSDGLLIGYLKSSSSLEDCIDAMAATEVSKRWEQEMAPLFLHAEDGRGLHALDRVFNLEEQLVASHDDTSPAMPLRQSVAIENSEKHRVQGDAHD